MSPGAAPPSSGDIPASAEKKPAFNRKARLNLHNPYTLPRSGLVQPELCRYPHNAGLESFYRHRQLGMTLAAEAVVERTISTWDELAAQESMEFKSAEVEENPRRQAGDLFTAYFNQVPEDEPQPVAVETAMEVPLIDPAANENLGIPLVGIVDLILDADNGPTIIDFKTAACGGVLLEIAHEVQLTAYSFAYRSATGRREGELQIRRLVRTKAPKIEMHSFPARSGFHFRRLFHLVRAYLNDLDADRFVFRPGFGGRMCDYCQTHCREWGG